MYRWSCFALLIGVSPLLGQEGQPIKLTLRPMAAPTPALKYQLLPELADQTPGNAVLLYYRAFSPEWQSHRRDTKFSEKLEKWQKMPLKDLPRKELQWLERSAMLKELDLGARREQCDWELTARARKEGISMLLPDIQGFREFANLLVVRARLEMASGDFSKAVYTLQTGYTLSRHLGEAPLLIPSLVGMAIATVMDAQVETLIQQPDAPNLYWALTALPQPLVNLRKAYSGEKLIILSLFPDLEKLESGPVSVQQAQEQIDRAGDMLRWWGAGFSSQSYPEKAAVAALVAKFYPRAKRYLIDKGRSTEIVEAMPTLQVVLLYSFDQFRRLQDELYKWTTLPYWQAAPGLRQAEKLLMHVKSDFEEGLPLASLLLPALQKVFEAQARTDRRIAALRCIEAIRLHAAAHDGQWPETLSAITAVPIPTDPMTGKEFEYRLAGDKAVLRAGVPAGETAAPHNTLVYELSLQR
jgi:hypothetical protein